MAGIDANVVLGLAGKLQQVFAEEGTYQAFPLAPIGLKTDSLSALAADPFGAGATAHAQFSLLVNEVPVGPLWQPDGSRRLWDVYGEVLTDAELLEESRTPEQQKAYAQAFDLLYVIEGGVPAPSPKVVAYEQYRDAYLASAMEYNNRKGEAATSGDPEVAAAWEADEPGLRAAVDDAKAAWSGPGNRAEVEEARRVLRDLGSDSPLVAWAGFRKLFDPDLPEIFFRTSVDGLSYVPTGYLPTDVVDVAWPRITVTADELRLLADAAPEELRSRLGGSADAGIGMVSFEYSFVTVARPWFSPLLFASRAWRFRDPERVLSDGGAPPAGECTAYVTGLVLARNITVQHKADGGERPDVDLGFLPTLQRVRGRTLLPLRTGDGALPEGDDRPQVLFPSLRKPEIRLRRPLPTPDPQSAETTTDPTDLFVLALHCRLLPRSPDPDPTMTGGVSKTGRKYTVRKGDTLRKIAARFYDDAGQWQKIYDANRKIIGKNPGAIRTGQKLSIP